MRYNLGMTGVGCDMTGSVEMMADVQDIEVGRSFRAQ